jgi:hypothetical protein
MVEIDGISLDHGISPEMVEEISWVLVGGWATYPSEKW